MSTWRLPVELRLHVGAPELERAAAKAERWDHDVLVKSDDGRSAFVTPNGKLYFVLHRAPLRTACGVASPKHPSPC